MLGLISANVLGIAEGGEIEAVSFDFAPRRADAFSMELNYKKYVELKSSGG